MGSSWRYRHVKKVFLTGSLIHTFFTGLHRSKQKNKSAHLAHSTFSQHFPTQASPYYPQLDPIYYEISIKVAEGLGTI